jgi:CDP-diacylglycerol--glycerol-3-phosphate 3-phosphatidyltransferase
MATIYELKPAFQSLLRPIVNRLAKAGVSANGVTLLALVLGFTHGAWLALQPGVSLPLLLLPLTLFLRMALNAIDGMLAREHKQASPAGALLNELSDVLSDAVLYLPLALIAGISAQLVVIVVVLGIMAEMAGALGPMLGVKRHYDGPLGKSDRASAFGLFAFLIGIGIAPGEWSTLYLALMLALSAATILNRARAILASVKGATK